MRLPFPRPAFDSSRPSTCCAASARRSPNASMGTSRCDRPGAPPRTRHGRRPPGRGREIRYRSRSPRTDRRRTLAQLTLDLAPRGPGPGPPARQYRLPRPLLERGCVEVVRAAPLRRSRVPRQERTRRLEVAAHQEGPARVRRPFYLLLRSVLHEGAVELQLLEYDCVVIDLEIGYACAGRQIGRGRIVRILAVVTVPFEFRLVRDVRGE